MVTLDDYLGNKVNKTHLLLYFFSKHETSKNPHQPRLFFQELAQTFKGCSPGRQDNGAACFRKHGSSLFAVRGWDLLRK